MSTERKPEPKSTKVVGFLVREPHRIKRTGMSRMTLNLNIWLRVFSSSTVSGLEALPVVWVDRPMTI